MMKGWSKLKPGDLIDIVAPGSATQPGVIAEAVKTATELGFTVRIPQGLIHDHPLHAHEDEQRLRFLKDALYAKDSKMVWCLRGGYGSNRLIPWMQKWKAPVRSKLFVGYSDITTLHLFLQQKWKWISCHGPVFESLNTNKMTSADLSEISDLFFGRIKQSQFRVAPLNAQGLALKKMRTTLVGGNLTTLQSAVGTAISPKLTGKTLFLEDIGERGYRVDRMLEHLQQAKVLKGCQAVIFGDFTHGNERDGSNHISYALERFAGSVSIPVFHGLPSGHGEVNKPLFFGAPAVLEGGDIGRLTMKSGVKG